jgi:hypothetical protein
MKLNKKEQSVDASVFLRRGNKILSHREDSVEQRLKEQPSRLCPTWGSMPYRDIKLRHYCGYQKVLTDRSLT